VSTLLVDISFCRLNNITSIFTEKCGFQQSIKANSEGKFWMYRRLLIDIVQVITENINITESVSFVLRNCDYRGVDKENKGSIQEL
jgi:hypothetical protein